MDRQIVRAFRLHEAVRDEILFAFVPEERRGEVTRLAYDRLPANYGPGGRGFEGGLLPWEVASLELMNVRRGSRVLVGGVGGGRELSGLCEMGCRIVAFDPSPALTDAASRVGERLGIPVYRASYEDFVEAEARRDGPLARLLGPHDAVVLGRGSFGHLTHDAQQLALLRALRRSSPEAPVLLSFETRSADDQGESLTVRRALRAVFGRVGGQPVPAGLRYDTRRGFVYQFTEPELLDLSRRAGYRVAVFERSPYALRGGRPPAHAVLVPDG